MLKEREKYRKEGRDQRRWEGGKKKEGMKERRKKGRAGHGQAKRGLLLLRVKGDRPSGKSPSGNSWSLASCPVPTMTGKLFQVSGPCFFIGRARALDKLTSKTQKENQEE